MEMEMCPREYYFEPGFPLVAFLLLCRFYCRWFYDYDYMYAITWCAMLSVDSVTVTHLSGAVKRNVIALNELQKKKNIWTNEHFWMHS